MLIRLCLPIILAAVAGGLAPGPPTPADIEIPQTSSTAADAAERLFSHVAARNERTRVALNALFGRLCAEIEHLVATHGVRGDVRRIVRAARRTTTTYWQRLRSEMHSNGRHARLSAAEAVSHWFTALPVTVRRQQLAQHYRDQMLQTVDRNLRLSAAHLSGRYAETMEDMRANLARLWALHLQAMADTSPQWESVFVDAVRSACAVIRESDAIVWRFNAELVDGVASRVRSLIAAVEAMPPQVLDATAIV